MTWHYAFVHNKTLEEWDVYEVYLDKKEDESGLYLGVSRTASPVMHLPGSDLQELVSLLFMIYGDLQKGNYFESLQDLDSNYEIL